PENVAADFETLLVRRLNHEPLAYIFGEWEFFSLPMIVRPPALVPRPETEHLVEAALAHIGSRGRSPSRGSSSGGSGEPIRVADIGAGTGCVAVAIAVNAPQAEV